MGEGKGKEEWGREKGKREWGMGNGRIKLRRMRHFRGLLALFVVVGCASRMDVRSAGVLDLDASGAGGAAGSVVDASRDGLAGTSGSGGSSDKVDGHFESGSADAGAPFVCGGETCAPEEICVYRCCPRTLPPPPPCFSRPDGSTCPSGTVEGCFIGTCPASSCCQPAPPAPCTPPPPYCSKPSAELCVQSGRNCYYLCRY
jgi:hypothetical protein